jgi:hypothetical protein
MVEGAVTKFGDSGFIFVIFLPSSLRHIFRVFICLIFFLEARRLSYLRDMYFLHKIEKTFY